MDKRTICLLNDSFPPEIDGVANAVVNYAKNITKSGENAIVVTPTMPGADDSAFPFPVLRYPSIDTRKKLGYVAGYPFSPETARVLTEQKVELMHTHCPITSCLLARSLRAVVDAPCGQYLISVRDRISATRCAASAPSVCQPALMAALHAMVCSRLSRSVSGASVFPASKSAASSCRRAPFARWCSTSQAAMRSGS